MRHVRKKGGYDPFALSTDQTMQLAILRDIEKKYRAAIPVSSATYDQFRLDMRYLRRAEKRGRFKVVDNHFVQRFGGATRSEANKKDKAQEYTKRVLMAVIGGGFLIGPMLVMVLHRGLVTSLVTTSVCVFAFGLVMCRFVDEPLQILSNTAAYAAVLVVFIGTGGGT